MEFTFADAIRELGPNFALRIANETRPAEDYLLAQILPPIELPEYDVSSGAMTITPTMAGLSGMDAPFRTGGHVSFSEFREGTAKITNTVPLSERALRKLHSIVQDAQLRGGNPREVVLNTLLNFVQKVIVQPHIDTAEWLRGQALANGSIDWTYGDIRLQVDYGIPDENVQDTRTIASGEAYSEANSTFWADHRAATKALGYSYNGPYMHPETYNAIIQNPANNIQVVANDGNEFTLQKRPTDASGNLLGGESQDFRDRVTVTLYKEEGEILDPNDQNSTINVPFWPEGRITYVGTGNDNAFRVGQGATDDALTDLALGYTHIGPTTEQGGVPGRYAKAFTPQQQPWSLIGEGASNVLPIIESESKLAIISTELPAA